MTWLKHPLAIIIGFYLFFCLYSLPLIGMDWDEPAHHQMAAAAWDFLTGKTSTQNFEGIGAIYSGTFEHLINKAGANFGSSVLGMGYVDAHHLTVPLLMIVGLIFFYKLATLLTSRRIAIIATLIFILHPRLLSLSLYDNKDISLLTVDLAALYYLYLAISTQKLKSAILAGIAYGISLSIQLTTELILVIASIPAIYSLSTNLQLTKKYLILGGIFIGISLVTMFILWPTLWQDPSIFFQAFEYFFHHAWQGKQTYFGHLYPASEIPWHYPLFYIFGTLPVLIIALLVIGLVKITKQFSIRKTRLANLLLLSWLFIPLGVYTLSSVVKYDGLRHYLDIVPIISIIAAIGFSQIIYWLEIKFPHYKSKMLVSGIIALLIYLSISLFQVLPYGDSYFNEVVQIAYPQNIDQQFEIEYWGEAYREAADWINQNATPNAQICVPIADHLFQVYPVRSDLRYQCTKTSKYLMFITRYSYLPANTNDYLPYQQLTPIYEIRRLNSALVKVYQVN